MGRDQKRVARACGCSWASGGGAVWWRRSRPVPGAEHRVRIRRTPADQQALYAIAVKQPAAFGSRNDSVRSDDSLDLLADGREQAVAAIAVPKTEAGEPVQTGHRRIR